MTNLSNIILEKLDTLVVVINKVGNIEYVNPSVKKVLGFEPETLIGKNWLSTTTQNVNELLEIKSNTIQLLKSTNDVEKSFSVERKIKNSNGFIKWILWNLSLGPNQTIIGIGQEITERKNTEQLLINGNNALKEKNKEIVDSISYSLRIQQAILPNIDLIQSKFDEAFVLYKPKDIVSGDFYWFYERNNKKFIAAIDCTGHGVPGALMTILGNSLLKNIVRQGTEDPGEILSKLDEYLYEELNLNRENKTPDGMDVSLCVFDDEKQTVQFSGAFRPLVLIRDYEFIEFKGARYPIGFYDNIDKKFETTEIATQKGDTFYLFSDGFVDQFGGEKQKKFNKKSFRNLLLDIQYLSLEEQEGYLEYSFNNWKQNEEQTDDVLIVGLKF
jgi:PAS domain S-box-containing protein